LGPVILGFVTSFFIVLFATPSLIQVAFLKGLVDEPGEERKLHKKGIPTIGGIIIFSATIFSYSIWYPSFSADNLKYIVAVSMLLFFIGVKDDIIGTAPVKKLIAHVVAGLILVLMADVRISGLYGIFGVREIPEWAGVFLSLFTYIVIVNAFNLIDGVDGLAAGIGVIASAAFAFWFYVAGEMTMAVLAISLTGALLGFLIFNFYPAKIFMGDSGSLTIGFIFSVLAIRMIEYKSAHLPVELLYISKPVMALAILAYPLLDTLRIFIYRSIRGMSPFMADKNHIHHRLLDIGLNQRQTVVVIYLYTIAIIATAFLTEGINSTYAFLIVGGVAIAIAQVPFMFPKIKNRKS
jgi:UDP-GlcNAc:undecaprenyl-phosphate/decaprenyl-phosphate GlcNAc-1-phosphate transferase